ncbi:MAG: hypothetical protein KKH98_03150, partial [Spirochaetes bacterium]|nr:hypothetical protein [Spirochaetota bacterium]
MILRKIIFTIICLFLIFDPLFSTKIEIRGKQMFVNDKPFIIRGFCYSPIPVGFTHTYEWEFDEPSYNTDFPLMKAMGANTVRTYDPLKYKKVLDEAYKNGLYVIMQVRIDWDEDYGTNIALKNEILYGSSSRRGLQEIVTTLRDHPALLMWCLGHEVNFNVNLDAGGTQVWDGTTITRLQGWYTFLNEMAGKIHEWEGPYWHPVTSG